MSDRISQAADAICAVIETRALTIGDFIEALDLALHRQYEATIEHLVRTEQLRLLRDIHGAVMEGDQLRQKAQNLVDWLRGRKVQTAINELGEMLDAAKAAKGER